MQIVNALVYFLIFVLIAGVVWWAGKEILARTSPSEPIATVAYVVLIVVVALLVIYGLLAFVGGAPGPALFR